MASAGGAATVESAPGEGTEVALRIGTRGDGPMSAERPRVVVVDDHPLFRAGVRAELLAALRGRRRGRRSRRGGAVIAQTTPDVVLLDVHLPDGGGVAVLHALTELAAPPPVLALSVSDAAEDVVPMIRAGALGYVTKTIRPPN